MLHVMVTAQASVTAQGVKSVFNDLAKMTAKTLNNFSENSHPCLQLGKDEVNLRYLVFKEDRRKNEFFHSSALREKIWFIAL